MMIYQLSTTNKNSFSNLLISSDPHPKFLLTGCTVQWFCKFGYLVNIHIVSRAVQIVT